MLFGNNQNYDWTEIKRSLFQTDSVHLWLAQITTFGLGNIIDLLSEEEILKGDKFYFSKDRQTYLVSRGLLRFLLGKYLNISARDIRFDYNPFGKPQIDFLPSEELFFNVSHSGEFCLIGLSRSNQIGVDIELIKPVDYDFLSKNVFSKAELAEFQSIPNNIKSKAFYCGWTRKESFIKGIGKGLSFPLKNFSVTLKPGILISKVEISSEESEIYKDWQTYDISFDPNYCAAFSTKNTASILIENFNANSYFQLFR